MKSYAPRTRNLAADVILEAAVTEARALLAADVDAVADARFVLHTAGLAAELLEAS